MSGCTRMPTLPRPKSHSWKGGAPCGGAATAGDAAARDVLRDCELLARRQIEAQAVSEVKGVGDRLQVHQRRWMTHFMEHEIPAELMHIVWS